MFKKFSALLLSTTIILGSIPNVLANEHEQSSIHSYSVVVPYSNSLKAFNDIENNAAKAAIEYLIARDMLKGYGHSMFRPEVNMTNAEAITLLTQAFQLSLDDTDSIAATYKNLNSNWYSKAFAIASANDVIMSKDIEPSGIVTREQFASWIIHQLDRIGVYPVVRMYIHIADDEQISIEYGGAVQTLLLIGLASLGEDQNFRPKDAITRAEASDWIADAVKFADQLRKKNEANKVEVNNEYSFLSQDQFALMLKQALKLDDVTKLESFVHKK